MRTHPVGRTRFACVMLLASGLTALQACGVETPVGPQPRIDGFEASQTAEGRPGITDEPSFTPFDRAPSITNRDEVRAALDRGYPALLKDAGVGGRVIVWLQIDEAGSVRRTTINTSSGHRALDLAALRLGYQMRFRPAENDGEIVPVWVSIPVQYTP